MQLQMTTCPACSEDKLPVKRKELGYHVCVDCSTAKPVVGITTVEGSGDHTYNDIIIMDQDRALSIQAAADEIAGKKSHLEVLDFDKDENEVTQSVKEAVHNVVNDEETEYDMFNPDQVKEGIKGIDY
tara:strand:- start:107 stop:490 length:384 start_codon:yes stop_codon:yes gene_type:complete